MTPFRAVFLRHGVAGCGDEAPTAPSGAPKDTPPVAGVSVSVQKLDFGVVCFGSDKTMETEGDCTQLLIEVDGKERIRDGYDTSCRERVYTAPLTPGKHRVGVGTDKSALCGADLAIWRMKFEFDRPRVNPDELY